MIANLASEVVAVEIAPIELFGKLRVRNVLCAAVLVPEGLGLLKDLIPVFLALIDVLLLGGRILS